KVTEYPGTSNVPRTSNAGKSPLRFPELEAQPNVYQSIHPAGPVFDQNCPSVEHEHSQGAHHPGQAFDGQIPGPHGPIHRHMPLEGRPHDGEVHPHGAGQPHGEFHPHGDIHQPGPHGPLRPNGPGAAENNQQLRPIPQEQPLPVAPQAEPEL
ncbi:MAG: hypothetical protein H7Z17_10190, partial [Fuerstia sp.]|nr:hypothetical protein [Fuerstiella sp.]